VSTAGQKPDLQHDGLSAYAKRAGLEVIEIYCDVAVSGRREGRPQLNALMTVARNYEINCVLAWKLDRSACSTRHLLTALKEFNHLGVSFVSVQDQVDTDSPKGWAMFTIIGTMAELESSLISERVTAGMNAARVRGKRIGRPPLAPPVVTGMEALVATTGLSIRQIQREVGGRASRAVVGEITKRVRAGQPNAL
jgi:DNA invertase Pin-like site-specific DNA recombinase